VTSGDADLSKVIDTSGFATKEDLGLLDKKLSNKLDNIAGAIALLAEAMKS
jgi:hypothetical protein